jgi:hypothetical protein
MRLASLVAPSLLAAVLLPSTAYALTAPSVSTGTYTVSWTEPSGGQQSRTFTKPPGTYTYRLLLCFFEPELGRELCELASLLRAADRLREAWR